MQIALLKSLAIISRQTIASSPPPGLHVDQLFPSSSAKINQHLRAHFFSDVNLLLSPPGPQLLQTNTISTTTTDHHTDQAACDMARAETMESAVSGGGDAGASGGRGGSSLPRHITCRMEIPHAARYLPCPPLPWLLHPETVDGSQEVEDEEEDHHLPASPSSSSSSPSSSPPPSPSYSQGEEERGGGGETPPPGAYPSGDQLRGERRTDSDNEEESPEASGLGRGPLPDLLPENEHPSWPVPRHRPPVAEAGLEAEARRVGRQLRAIGDDLNSSLLHRAAAPQWRDWRGVCQVLINFVRRR